MNIYFQGCMSDIVSVISLKYVCNLAYRYEGFGIDREDNSSHFRYLKAVDYKVDDSFFIWYRL